MISAILFNQSLLHILVFALLKINSEKYFCFQKAGSKCNRRIFQINFSCCKFLIVRQ